MFFEGNSDRIAAYLDTYHALDDSEDGGNEDEHLTGDLFQASLAKSARTPVSPSANGSNGSWLHSGKIDAVKKKKAARLRHWFIILLLKNTVSAK
ncbi:hypothetical protein [Mucilaginibacter antarcticus]|uniref:hypothetical protein n=1 Tax=Mucilaginibacter antarcticus TaxID=1855725 RepID=UPI0036418EE7